MKLEFTSIPLDIPLDIYVRDAKEGVSRAGNPMITLTLSVYAEGREITRFEALTPLYPPLITMFCQATGLEQQLANKELSEDDCKYKNLQAIYKNDPKGRDGISVAKYLTARANSVKEMTPKDLEDFDDKDIPF